MVLSWHLQVGTEENHQTLVTVVSIQVYIPTRHMQNTIRLNAYKTEALC